MKPYKENKSGNIIRRTFSKDVHTEELVWHRDKSDRIVLVLEDTDWMVQFDNELPKKLNVNEEYFIPKNTFHRIIKGSNDLIVEIIETEFELDEYEIVEVYNINEEEITAYHGSPHSFDKFSTEYMGTGEGAQAFGWGLYFTDLEDIAKNYAKQLSSLNSKIFIGGKEQIMIPDHILYIVKDILEINGGDVEKTIENAKDRREGYADNLDYADSRIKYNKFDKAIKYLEKNKEKVKLVADRNLYKVTLHKGKTPDQYTWLDWDLPVPDSIYETIGYKLKYNDKFLRHLFQDSMEFEKTDGTKVKGDRPTGLLFYKRISTILGSDKKASLFLLKNGIDGIRYPAESIARGKTRDDARGFNYVVFDENAVEIHKKMQFENKNIKEGKKKKKKDACYYKVRSRYSVWPSAYACVPENTSKALTRDGWRNVNQLNVGDEIMTYNIEKDELEFKPILNLHRYKDVKTNVVRSGSNGFIFEATDNHKWVVKLPEIKGKKLQKYNRINDKALIETSDLLLNKNNKSLVVSAPYNGGNNLKLDEIFKYGTNWIKYVLDITSEQRQAWLFSAIIYDGNQQKVERLTENINNIDELNWLYTGPHGKQSFGFKQKDIEHRDAFLLSAFLNSGLVTWKKAKDKDIYSCHYSSNKNLKNTSNFKLIKENIADVWCPETENGTWVMMQETEGRGIITITGNSGALVKCRKVGAKNWGNKTNENEENLDEKWSEKYKKSIDCNNPKGFSQRAHCQGRLKENLEELNISQEEINQILKGYIEAALWTEEERLKYEYNEQYPSLSDDDEFDEDETDEEKELQKIIKVSANLNKKSFNQFTNQDIEPNSLIRAYKDIKKFLKIVGNKIQEAIYESGLEQVGHDIWLTRNRHGAGFGDRFYEYEDYYVKAAHLLGEVNLYINDSLKLSFDNEHVIDEAKKTDFSKEKEQGLHGWFARQGGKGKSKGWVDCNTCKKDPETGRKKCKTCGRKEGENRSKYPACRPTPSACSTRGKGKKWGKKSKSKTNENLNIIVKKSIFEENLLKNILNETFKQDEDMRNVEPSVKPQPTVVPQTEPDKKPSRREIFKPIRETKPKPKAHND